MLANEKLNLYDLFYYLCTKINHLSDHIIKQEINVLI